MNEILNAVIKAIYNQTQRLMDFKILPLTLNVIIPYMQPVFAPKFSHFIMPLPLPTVGTVSNDARPTSVCLSRASGLSRKQRGLGRLKLAQW